MTIGSASHGEKMIEIHRQRDVIAKLLAALKAIEARAAEAWNAQRPGDHRPDLPDITRIARAAIAEAKP